MSPIERQKVAAKIFECALFYGKDLSREQVTGFLDVLSNQFTAEASVFISAIDQHMKDPKNKFFPAPVHLRQFIEPEVQTEDVSVSLVADIATAVRRHGYEWPNGYFHHSVDRYWFSKGNKLHTSWEDAVRSELGDIGVEVVRRYTWRGLCDTYHNGNLPAFNAQIKQFITATQNIIKSSNGSNVYQLKEPDRKHVLNGEVRNGIQVYTKPESEDPTEPA